MPSRKDELCAKADAERQRCRKWLLERMRDGKRKALTKAQYRDQAMAELQISKNSFNALRVVVRRQRWRTQTVL